MMTITQFASARQNGEIEHKNNCYRVAIFEIDGEHFHSTMPRNAQHASYINAQLLRVQTVCNSFQNL